jgi:hypothetical protein
MKFNPFHAYCPAEEARDRGFEPLVRCPLHARNGPPDPKEAQERGGGQSQDDAATREDEESVRHDSGDVKTGLPPAEETAVSDRNNRKNRPFVVERGWDA